MKRLTQRQMASFLAYCDRELLRPDLPEERRATLEQKAEFYRRNLAGHCRRCGRPIEAPDSLERGIGPECWTRLDQGDADDRAYDRAVAHELSAR